MTDIDTEAMATTIRPLSAADVVSGVRRAGHYAYLHAELSDRPVSALVRRDGTSSGHAEWLRLARHLVPAPVPVPGMPTSTDPMRTVLSLTRTCDHLDSLRLLGAGNRGLYAGDRVVAAWDGARPQLTIDVEERDDLHVLRLTGELDLATVPTLEERLRSEMCSTLQVDLADLTFCDAAGLSTLVTTKRGRERNGCRIRIVGATGIVRRVFAVTGLECELDE